MINTRRRWLIAGAAGALPAAYLVAMGAGAAKPCGSPDAPGAQRLQAALRIGRAYLRAEVRPQDEALLRAAAALNAPAFAARLQAEAKTLPERAQADFECGDTVTCDGWVLARSEALYCAEIAYRDMAA